MRVAELRERLAEFDDAAEVYMLFDSPSRIESHSIENVTKEPHDRLVRENGNGNVYLEWRTH